MISSSRLCQFALELGLTARVGLLGIAPIGRLGNDPCGDLLAGRPVGGLSLDPCFGLLVDDPVGMASREPCVGRCVAHMSGWQGRLGLEAWCGPQSSSSLGRLEYILLLLSKVPGLGTCSLTIGGWSWSS